MNAVVTADEVNVLVYRYLQESGASRSCYRCKYGSIMRARSGGSLITSSVPYGPLNGDWPHFFFEGLL